MVNGSAAAVLAAPQNNVCPPNTDLPWVIFSIDKQRYALSSQYVREMTTFNGFVSIPYAADFVRGAIQLRGEIMTLVDFRVWVGLPSALTAANDLVAEMRQREQDHRDWLDELEASIRQKRAFTKATDPHKCAFGKWYDNYKTDNAVFRDVLRRFAAPHAAIHAIAERALAAAQGGSELQAMAIIDETRNTTLSVMIKLFGEFRDIILNQMREIALIVGNGQKQCAIVVDTVESVEPLKQTFDSTSNMHRDSDCVQIPWLGRRIKDDTPVLIPDVEILLSRV
ncbi:MAG: chemotaxis protein CheW [Candidatus Hydrogenedentes bacterium]|nr:chemotaxis protein CheW [Candidatus Hydrogenedentota bacterium]